MAATGLSLRQVPSTIGWSALASLAANLGMDSAVYRVRNPEMAAWATVAKTNALLADLIDAVGSLAWMYACANRGRGPRPRKPKPYPRPWLRDDGERHFGSGAIPRAEFLSWYYSG